MIDITDLMVVINGDGYMDYLHISRNEGAKLCQKETYLFSKPRPGMSYIV